VPKVAAFDLESRSLEEALDGAALAVVVTAHPDVDHHAVAERLPLVDLRGVTRKTRRTVA
jgi:UDP-N-acetyl-D-glucosamine dehydrogenase